MEATKRSLDYSRIRKKTGIRIVASPASCANNLGLTQQMPIVDILYRCGPAITLTFIRRKVFIRTCPPWYCLLEKTVAGESILAMAWGRELSIKQVIKHLNVILTEEDKASILEVRSQLPEWIQPELEVFIQTNR